MRALLFIGCLAMGAALVFILPFSFMQKRSGPASGRAAVVAVFCRGRDGDWRDDSGQKRYWVSLDDMSPYLVQATIAIEDQGFTGITV